VFRSIIDNTNHVQSSQDYHIISYGLGGVCVWARARAKLVSKL